MTRYIGKQPAFGNFVKLDAISVVNGQAAYTMQSGSSNFTNYDNVNQFIVSLNGVIQAPTDSFTVSGSTITFASALSTGDVINFIMVYGNVLDIGTPSDDTISTAKLQNTSVTAGKLATDSVIEAKIQNDAVTRDKINAISTSSAPSFEAKGDGSSVEGKIQLNCHVNSHGVVLQSPPHSSGQSYTIKLPDNQIAVDKFIKVKSITGSGSTAVGQTEFADAGGGKVLQVITAEHSTEETTSSTSFVDSTLSAQITPSATTSKVLVLISGSQRTSGNASEVFSTVFRDSTNLGSGSGVSISYTNGGNITTPICISVLDSPSSTSALTYRMKFRASGSHAQYVQAHNSKSTIILMEIGA